MSGVTDAKEIAVFIGPEGGFEESEIDFAFENGVKPISLGKRILRTETAGLAILSVLMFRLDVAKEDI
jgi:16S rRNA (uracil1498-N3)-methyltransferase